MHRKDRRAQRERSFLRSCRHPVCANGDPGIVGQRVVFRVNARRDRLPNGTVRARRRADRSAPGRRPRRVRRSWCSKAPVSVLHVQQPAPLPRHAVDAVERGAIGSHAFFLSPATQGFNTQGQIGTGFFPEWIALLMTAPHHCECGKPMLLSDKK